jgi:tetratricopeptide (TPR) repeat protein
LAIHRDMGYRREECTTLGNLGAACCRLGRQQEGMRHYDAALTIARDITDRRFEAFLLRELGNEHLAAGRIDSAAAHAIDALALNERIDDRVGMVASLACIGAVRYAGRNPAEARETLSRAERLARETNYALGISRILCIRARGEAGLGDREGARAALEQARAALSDDMAEESVARVEIAAVALLLE